MGMVTSVLWGRLWARWAVGQVFGGELLGALGLPAFGLLVWVVLVPWSGGSSFWGWCLSVVGLVSRGACCLAGKKGAHNMFFCVACAGGRKRCQQEDACEKSAVGGGGSIFCSSLMMEEADAVPWMVA